MLSFGLDRKIGWNLNTFNNTIPVKKQYDTWDDEDGAGYQLCLQGLDTETRTYRAWHLIVNPRNLPQESIHQDPEF